MLSIQIGLRKYLLLAVSGALRSAVLCTLPELTLGQVLSHHKQEDSIYVNNAGPRNTISTFAIAVVIQRFRLVLQLSVLSLPKV